MRLSSLGQQRGLNMTGSVQESHMRTISTDLRNRFERSSMQESSCIMSIRARAVAVMCHVLCCNILLEAIWIMIIVALNGSWPLCRVANLA